MGAQRVVRDLFSLEVAADLEASQTVRNGIDEADSLRFITKARPTPSADK